MRTLVWTTRRLAGVVAGLYCSGPGDGGEYVQGRQDALKALALTLGLEDGHGAWYADDVKNALEAMRHTAGTGPRGARRPAWRKGFDGLLNDFASALGL